MHRPLYQYTPPNADDAVRAYEGCRRRAEQMLRDATTAEDRMHAQFWIDNADRQLDKWRRIADRQVHP